MSSSQLLHDLLAMLIGKERCRIMDIRVVFFHNHEQLAVIPLLPALDALRRGGVCKPNGDGTWRDANKVALNIVEEFDDDK